MKKKIMNGSLALVALLSGVAQAGSLTCSGRVTQVNMHANDTFMLKLDSMDYPVYFCRTNGTFSVSGTQFTTSAETCRTLIALFLTAKVTEKRLSVIYFDGDEVPTACNAFGPWKNVNIRYFEWAD